jgi:hypothetical protein
MFSRWLPKKSPAEVAQAEEGGATAPEDAAAAAAAEDARGAAPEPGADGVQVREVV